MPFLQMSWGGSLLISSSLKTTRPLSGLSMPVIKLNRVVLPAPFGPITATSCPFSTVSSAPLTARNLSKDLYTRSTLSMFSPSRRTLFAPALSEFLDEKAHHPFGQEKDDEDQEHPEDQRPVLRVYAGKGPQSYGYRRAKDWAGKSEIGR